MVGALWRKACVSLGAVRYRLGKRGEFAFAWIIDFPLFEWNEDENKWDPEHHLFSISQERFLDTLEKDPGAVKGELYDWCVTASSSPPAPSESTTPSSRSGCSASWA